MKGLSFLHSLRPAMQRMTFDEAKQRIAEQAQGWKPDPRADAHWSKYARVQQPLDPVISQLYRAFADEGVLRGKAVDLGCGSGVHTLDLLAHRWDVTAVDCNQIALAILAKRAQELKKVCYQTEKTLDIGRLDTVNTRMEDFIFPSDVDLVIAMNSLPYCNPAKFLKIWNRAHDALRPGGRIVANFARAPRILLPFTMGAWHADAPVIDALLREKGYQVEYFRDFGRMMIASGNLMVIGRKG